LTLVGRQSRLRRHSFLSPFQAILPQGRNCVSLFDGLPFYQLYPDAFDYSGNWGGGGVTLIGWCMPNNRNMTNVIFVSVINSSLSDMSSVKTCNF
jgi:hypothetical protein